MLTATTLALPPRTNMLRPTKKDPKDTPNRVFNKLAWHQIYGTEGVLRTVLLPVQSARAIMGEIVWELSALLVP